MQREKIGQNIERIRKLRGWSRREFARRAGSCESTLSRHIITGVMSLDALFAYAETLGCTVGDLTDGATDPEQFRLDVSLSAYYPYNLAGEIATQNRTDKRSDAAREIAASAAQKTYAPALIKAVEELGGREGRIIKLRYYNGMTLEQVADTEGITRERVRQLEARALRRLRHPRVFETWQLTDPDKLEQIRQERDQLRLANISLRDQLMEKTPDEQERRQIMQTVRQQTGEKNIRVEEMRFTFRTYNCLRRAGIGTLAEIAARTPDEIMQIRGLGRRSFDEIRAKLDEYGATLKEGKEDE